MIQKQCDEIEKGLVIGERRQANNLTKMLRRKFTPRVNVIQNQNGNILQSQDEIIEQWTKYCSSLYRNCRGDDIRERDLKKITPVGIEELKNILYSKVEETIGTVKRNKSPGFD